MLPSKKNYFVDCNVRSQMKFNEACLKVENPMNTTVFMIIKSIECYKCNFYPWIHIDPLDLKTRLPISTDYTHVFGFQSEKGSSCNKTYTFKQHGIYKWITDFDCQPVIEIEPPDNPYIPLMWLFGLCIVIIIFYFWLKFGKPLEFHKERLYKFIRKINNDDFPESEISEAATTATTQTSRQSTELPVPEVLAIQVFRGMVMYIMIIQYSGMKDYWFLKHSPWNGVMPADFVYPFFLWSMGTVFFFKYRVALLAAFPRTAILREITLRSLRYFLLGLFLISFEQNTLPDLRYFGELQRYSILHCVMFYVEVLCMKKEIEEVNVRRVKDMVDSWVQTVFTAVCMMIYLIITYLMPVPNCPTGYTGPGGLHLYSSFSNCSGGAARFIDSLILGDSHLYKYPEFKNTYKSNVSFEPEGFLGILSCCLTVYSGIQAGRVLVYYKSSSLRIKLLLTWGFLQVVLGLCFCGFSKEEGPIPLNKQLWSLSFALLTSGVAFIIFTLLYVIVDMYQWWLGTPCFEAGLNAMLIYAGRIVFQYSFPFSWVKINYTNYVENVLMCIINILFWVVICVILRIYNTIVLI